MDTRAAARRFADTWQHGWTHHDAITALYTDDVHHSMPFRAPHHGKKTLRSEGVPSPKAGLDRG
ncbi:hypothetical protein [Nonomuraea sp. NPDC046570]|uniref:hypothetical protein n=1 Tax=Nonomuraea sp. NPDC046570 TaxID=3155255 RepID=UPI0033F62D04